MNKVLSVLIVVPVLLAGCGSDDRQTVAQVGAGDSDRAELIAGILADPVFQKACAKVEGCGEAPRYPEPGATEAVWRVQVIREASGAIRFGRVDSIVVPQGGGVPLGPVAGTHRLVGRNAAGEPVDGQLLQFPEVTRVEYVPELPEPGQPTKNEDATRILGETFAEFDLSGMTVDAMGFVRALPEITELAVQAPDGSTVVRQPVSKPVGGLTARLLGSLVADAHAAGAIWPYENNIPPYCAHIVLLEGEIDRELAQGIAYSDAIVELTEPGPYQRASLFGALRLATPMLCQGIRRIATGRIPSDPRLLGAVQTVRTGDMMIINVAGLLSESSVSYSRYRQVQFAQTVLHEATHGVDGLLTAQGSRPGQFTGDWTMPARTMASETVDRVRLEVGLHDEWQRVHESFRQLGWASDYQSDEALKEAVWDWTPAQVSDGGYMSPYGATSVWDDIAEIVSITYLVKTYQGEGWDAPWANDYACQQTGAYTDEGVPSRFAAFYTKLMFVKDLGLVDEEDVARCLGDRVRLAFPGGGFHFWHDGNLLRSFDRNVTAKMGTNGGNEWVFEMNGEGEASFDQEMYPAKLRLQVAVAPANTPEYLVPWPRGVYPLQLMGSTNLRVDLEDKPAGGFIVKDGYVLIAEASNERIAGSAFLTVAMRMGAPIPVPQTWKPPLVIRFMIEK